MEKKPNPFVKKSKITLKTSFFYYLTSEMDSTPQQTCIIALIWYFRVRVRVNMAHNRKNMEKNIDFILHQCIIIWNNQKVSPSETFSMCLFCINKHVLKVSGDETFLLPYAIKSKSSCRIFDAIFARDDFDATHENE